MRKKTYRPNGSEKTQTRFCSSASAQSMFRLDGTAAERRPVFSFLCTVVPSVVKNSFVNIRVIRGRFFTHALFSCPFVIFAANFLLETE